MTECNSYAMADKMAKELGAVTYGNYVIQGSRQYAYYSLPEVFNRHYFNEEGLEVGYWHPCMSSFTKMEPPRVWWHVYKDELESGAVT
jgi:hypothetical protein